MAKLVGQNVSGGAITSSENTVESLSAAVIAWDVRSRLPRTLLGGTMAMRAAGEEFLPKDWLETDTNYKARLNRSFLVNAFGKTVSFLGGQVFQKPMVFQESISPELEEFNTDVDMAGNGVQVFSKRLFERGIAEGVVHLVVDTNNKDGEYTSKAQEKEAGVRPYFREVKGENIVAFLDENMALVQVRILEFITKREGRYGSSEVAQIRVLEPGTWETFQMDGSTWTSQEKGTTSLDYIPLVSFIPGEPASIMTGQTPLMDLAELNLYYWQSKSDQTNILHESRVPLKFGKMLDIDALNNSAHSMLVTDHEDGDLKFVELQGKSIESGRQDLVDTESKMAMYGLQQLVPRTGTITATEKALTSAESNSSLGMWTNVFEDFINSAYKILGEYEGVDVPEDVVSVNKEFTTGIFDPEAVNSYVALVGANIMSAESAFSEMKLKGIISEDLDWLDVVAQMNNEFQSTSLLPNTFGNTNTNNQDDDQDDQE